MASNYTLTINYDGHPLVGAEVISNAPALFMPQAINITDANGQITGSTPDAFASVILLAVRHIETGVSIYIATMVFEAGNNYILNIPHLPEQAGDFWGVHSHFAMNV